MATLVIRSRSVPAAAASNGKKTSCCPSKVKAPSAPSAARSRAWFDTLAGEPSSCRCTFTWDPLSKRPPLCDHRTHFGRKTTWFYGSTSAPSKSFSRRASTARPNLGARPRHGGAAQPLRDRPKPLGALRIDRIGRHVRADRAVGEIAATQAGQLVRYRGPHRRCRALFHRDDLEPGRRGGGIAVSRAQPHHRLHVTL